MSLVSNLFLLFVAASILIYYIVPRKSQWIVLLIFSYLYYIAGGPRYVVFILFSTLVTWLMALLIEKAEGKETAPAHDEAAQARAGDLAGGGGGVSDRVDSRRPPRPVRDRAGDDARRRAARDEPRESLQHQGRKPGSDLGDARLGVSAGRGGADPDFRDPALQDDPR